jgi:hypothetical protein
MRDSIFRMRGRYHRGKTSVNNACRENGGISPFLRSDHRKIDRLAAIWPVAEEIYPMNSIAIGSALVRSQKGNELGRKC